AAALGAARARRVRAALLPRRPPSATHPRRAGVRPFAGVLPSDQARPGDQAKLESLILAGQPRADRFVVYGLSRRVAGLLSELITRQIRERLAPGSATDVEPELEHPSYAHVAQTPIYLGRFISDRIYLRYERTFSARVGRAAASASEASAE